MPQVGAFFVGLFGGGLAGAVPALGAAGTALAAGAAVTNFFTTTIVGRLLLSTGLSAVSSWIARRNAPKPPGLRRDSASQGDTVPQTFILGRFGTPGHWVAPEMSHGTDNKYLTYVLDLGDMPVNGLAGVFLNGEAVEFSGTVHPDYGQEIGGKYAGHAWVKFYDGTQTVADPMLLAKYPVPHATPWLPDMVGIGMPLAIWTFKFSRTVWQGFPVPTHDVDGISLYDLTKDDTAGGVGAHRWADQSTWEFATDPVSMIYAAARGLTLPDGRVWGGRYAESELRYADWADAIETCRDLVTVTTDGDPAEVTEPRYRAGFEVTVADEPASIIEELLKACCGKVADVGDALRIRVDGPGLPVYSFAESDILLDATASLRPVRPHAELVNSISASYPEPLTGYQPKDVPPLTDTDLETAHGERLTRAASFAAVPYGLQVQRIIAAELADHQRAERLAVMLPPDADMIEPLDTVTATLPSYNFAATDFEVEQVTHDPKTGAVFATMRVRDAVDYVVDSARELQAALPDVAAPDPGAIPVRSCAVVAHTVTDETGTDRRPALKVTWDVGDVESVFGIEAEVRVAATATVIWRGTGPAADLGEWLLVEGIVPGVGYEVRTRHLSATRETEWTAWLPATAPDVRAGADDLQYEATTVWRVDEPADVTLTPSASAGDEDTFASIGEAVFQFPSLGNPVNRAEVQITLDVQHDGGAADVVPVDFTVEEYRAGTGLWTTRGVARRCLVGAAVDARALSWSFDPVYPGGGPSMYPTDWRVRAKAGKVRVGSYDMDGREPATVADFAGKRFRRGGAVSSFADLLTFARSGAATYVDATGTRQAVADGVARIDHHIWDASAGVWDGPFCLIEPQTTVNLLTSPAAPATQNVTVTAQPYTLHFVGSGTITLSGAYAGSLVGAGAGEANRQALTFTPAAGTLTLTVSGTVTDAQLEARQFATQFVDGTRNPETLEIAGAKLAVGGAMPAAVSLHLAGKLTYADTDTFRQAYFFDWYADGNNNIRYRLNTATTSTGQVQFIQEAAGVTDSVSSSSTYLSPGANQNFDIAGRHGATVINGAVAGAAGTANLTPTALADLSSTALKIAVPEAGVDEFTMAIRLLRIAAEDVADAGIEDASAGAACSVSLSDPQIIYRQNRR